MSEAAAAPRTDPGRLEQMAYAILRGETDIAALNGISGDGIEAIYGMGHGFYAAGQHRDAVDVFRFLCLHRHAEPRFWLGLAASSQVLGLHAVAVQAYGVCAMVQPEDPRVSLRAAECFIAINDAKSAGTGGAGGRQARARALGKPGEGAARAPGRKCGRMSGVGAAGGAPVGRPDTLDAAGPAGTMRLHAVKGAPPPGAGPGTTGDGSLPVLAAPFGTDTSSMMSAFLALKV